MMFFLFVILLILKLVGVIAWSWWIVTLPLWIGILLIIVVAGGFTAISALFVGFLAVIQKLFFRRKRRF